MSKYTKNDNDVEDLVLKVHNLFVQNVNDILLSNSSKQIVEEGLSIAHLSMNKSLRLIDVFINVENHMKNVEQNLLSELNNCISIMGSLDSLLKCLISSSYIEFKSFITLPKVVGQIMLSIFKHCEDSEILYSTHMQKISATITNVFKKCHELQISYFILLNEHCHFDLLDNEQSETIIDVIRVIVDIGEVVNKLDVKTMAEEWKGYTKFCELHLDWLKDKYINEKAIKILCVELESNVLFLKSVKVYNNKEVTRSLKVCNFILKILLKLTELFENYLTKNYDCLVSCLALIFQCSFENISYLKINITIIEGIQSHIQTGAEFLLSNLILDSTFKLAILKYCKENPVSLGFLYMSISITKLLLQKNDLVKDEWITDIFSLIIDTIILYDTELLRNYEFECVSIGRVSLYDYVLLHICSLLISSNKLIKIEQKLLECIFSPNIWKGLLASDIWIILAKNSSSEFCFEQLFFLFSIFTNTSLWNKLKNSPQNIYLSQVYSMLFNLLPDTLKIQIYKSYPLVTHSHIWKVMGLSHLPKDELSNVSLKLLKSPVIFNDWKSYTPSEYMQLVDCFQLLSSISFEMDSSTANNFVNKLIQAWEFAYTDEYFFKDTEKRLPEFQWYENYIVLLSNITQNFVIYLDNNSWFKIFYILSLLVKESNSTIKIVCLQILKCFVFCKIVEDEKKTELINRISLCFQSLLNDKNTIVRIESINTFVYMALNISDNCIIVNIAKLNKKIMEITPYIMPDEKEITAKYFIEAFKSNFEKGFKHKCRKIKECPSSISNNSTSQRINDCIITLREKCEELISVAAVESLSSNEKCKIKQVIDVLNNLIK